MATAKTPQWLVLSWLPNPLHYTPPVSPSSFVLNPTHREPGLQQESGGENIEERERGEDGQPLLTLPRVKSQKGLV
ncbi:Hypothetical predicted protein [Xyrichtys novacula]|uniref:Uncharacterized protein n=1 Tax=Xyrichtys novacula TaxID=13765 RepID=A0AAV1GH17_XYRNO|nr:Hypothetical predicted protein [Xyrichtys novacula]